MAQTQHLHPSSSNSNHSDMLHPLHSPLVAKAVNGRKLADGGNVSLLISLSQFCSVSSVRSLLLWLAWLGGVFSITIPGEEDPLSKFFKPTFGLGSFFQSVDVLSETVVKVLEVFLWWWWSWWRWWWRPHLCSWIRTLNRKSPGQALRNARKASYSPLIEANLNNPRFLFDTIARLVKSHSSAEPSIPAALSSEDFGTFFTNKKSLTLEKRSIKIFQWPPMCRHC